jgi:Flp pilus assembly protein TadD
MTRPPAVLSPEEASRLRDPGNGSRVEQALHFYRQGRARFERRELDAAEHLFREAVRLDPSQSQYHFNLAIVLSIRAHARHEHMHHEGCHVTCKLGGSLVSNPKVRYEAEQHLLKACELDPTNAQIPLKLGQLYKEARLNKKAEQYLKQALTLDSRNSVAQQELESLYEIEQNDELQVAQ